MKSILATLFGAITRERKPLSTLAALAVILLLSLGLWAAIWGIVAYPLASMLP